MTTTTVFGDAADCGITSYDDTYSVARDHGGLDEGLSPASLDGFVGQNFATPTYYCSQDFQGFDTSSIPDTDSVSAAVLSLKGSNDNDLSDLLTVEARSYDWGATVDLTDFRTGSELNVLTSCATAGPSTFTTGYIDFSSTGSMPAAINKTGFTRFVLCGARNVGTGTAPSGEEYWQLISADQTGTVDDPKLVVTHTGAIQANAEVSSVTVIGRDAIAKIKPSSSSSSTTPSALDATTRVNVVYEDGLTIGSSFSHVGSSYIGAPDLFAALAGMASTVITANPSTVGARASIQVASSTVVSYNSTTVIQKLVNAEAAIVLGVGRDAADYISVKPTLSSLAASASNASISTTSQTQATAGMATSTASSSVAALRIQFISGTSQTTISGLTGSGRSSFTASLSSSLSATTTNATGSITVPAATASTLVVAGPGAALANISISPVPSSGSVTGTAFGITGSNRLNTPLISLPVSAYTTVTTTAFQAGVASVSATSYNVAPKVIANIGVSIETSTGNNSISSVVPKPGAASVTSSSSNGIGTKVSALGASIITVSVSGIDASVATADRIIVSASLATLTITAYNETSNVNATQATASLAGTSYSVPIGLGPNTTTAAANGTASSLTIKVSPSASIASSLDTAYIPGWATSTSALGSSVSISSGAIGDNLSTSTGNGQVSISGANSKIFVSVAPPVASTTPTAYNTTSKGVAVSGAASMLSTAVNTANAVRTSPTLASASGAANNIRSDSMAGAQTATSSVVSNNHTSTTGPTETVASATVSGLTISAGIRPSSSVGQVSSSGNDIKAAVAPVPGVGLITVTAYTTSSVSAQAGISSSAVEVIAHSGNVATADYIVVQAQAAALSAAGSDTIANIVTSQTLAAAIGASYGSPVAVQTNTGATTVVVSAQNVSGLNQSQIAAGIASVAAVAQDATQRMETNPTNISVLAAAENSEAQNSINAGLSAITATAHNATIALIEITSPVYADSAIGTTNAHNIGAIVSSGINFAQTTIVADPIVWAVGVRIYSGAPSICTPFSYPTRVLGPRRSIAGRQIITSTETVELVSVIEFAKMSPVVTVVG